MIKPTIPAQFNMIDSETLSLDVRAVVTQIAAVRCDAENATITAFYNQYLNIDEQIKLGRKISASSLVYTLTEGNPQTIKNIEVPLSLSVEFQFEQSFDFDDVVMCNGADFDFPIIKSLLSDLDPDLGTPWSYKNQFCYRTLMSIFPVPAYKAQAKARNAPAHDALNDCIYQGIQAIGAYREANGLEYKEVQIIPLPSDYLSDGLPF